MPLAGHQRSFAHTTFDNRMRGNSGWRERCRQRPVSQRDPIEARKQGGLSLVLDLAGSYKEMANSARPARRSTALAFNSKSPSNRPSCSMIQLCGCFAMASSHCSTVDSVAGNKAGTVSEPLGSTPNICTIAGSKPRAKRVGYVPRFGVPQRNGRTGQSWSRSNVHRGSLRWIE